MAELRDYLAQLDRDPHDDRVIAAIESMGGQLAAPEAADALRSTRDHLRERGELELVARLFDLEIQAATDDLRRADLLMEQGQLYVDELLNERSGVECFQRVLALRPTHEEAQEALEELEQVRENWRRLVEKYLDEAQASTDRTLTTYMYQKAAETFARYEPDADEVEQYLRRALEVDPRNRKVATHLERLLKRKQRWPELTELYSQRIEHASTKDERINLLIALADLARERLGDGELAVDSMKKVIGAEPGHPRALALLADHYERDQNWSALVMLYTNALKARRRGSSPDVELGMLLQIAMLHWKRLNDVEAAEEYFRRMRKVAPAHPAALDFYRAYYAARNELGKLIQALRQALKSTPDDQLDAKRALSVEIAQLAEAEMGNAEKAIDAWKAILRAEPQSEDAREALKRLYARTEKWNALLDLMKDDVERLPKNDVRGRVSRLLEIVEIYRDRLKLDVMVINTYNSILQLEPDNEAALEALAAKYEQLARWNDLIVVLGRQADATGAGPERRVDILRRIAGLWIDRFGNFAQAIKPLEQLMEIAPPGSAAMADAVERLKDIYGRRRQWRALIQLLGREAEMLPMAARRQHLAQMASIASDRLGDARLAIQVWNRVLELPEESPADGPEVARALVALAGLYEREKRYPALAEIYRRQRERTAEVAEAVSILERLGTLFSERMRAPAAAADVYREILAIEPAHPRALRVMRELYASIGDYDAMERVYSELGQWDELVEAFYGVADRMEDRTAKLRLLERSAAIAAERFNQPEKIARCFERVLAVDATNVRAARALVPIYARSQKWSRLLSTFQILLDRADSDDERLELIDSIRDLCEKRLGSKALAFQWTARAYEIRPNDVRLLGDLERLGAEADAWEEVAAILHRRSEDEQTPTDERIRLLRELGRISSVRLHQYDRAQGYLQKLLELRPDDREAIGALEDIATQHSEWPQLLRIYRRKVELESAPAAKVDLLFKIAVIEEERVADLDAAAATYGKILEIDPSSRRALKALAKLDEARGDWEGLVGVLERELELATDDDTKVALLLRLGSLRENNLDRRYDALAGYKQALALGASNQVYAALERFLDQPGDRAETRLEVAQLLLPEYEKAGDARNIARVLEILRASATERHQVDIDRRLVKLYRQQTKVQESYDAAVRVLGADFTDADNRAELIRLAEELEIEDLMASELQNALDAAREAGAEPHARRALAAELAVIYEEHLIKPDLAEKAWLEVLSMEATDGAAYDALDRIYRSAEMWLELRALLERRYQNTLDPDRRKEILTAICQLNEGVLDDVGAAIDSHRRLLEIEPGMIPAYKALERLYAGSQRWPELEQLLAVEISHVGEDQQLDLAFRRAELRAGYLGDPVGAVDLCEEIAVRRSNHAGARGLLEQLIGVATVRGRVARLLEPVYEADTRWRDLINVLRVQVDLAGSGHDKMELLARIAGVEADRLGENRSAFATWVEALAADPVDSRPRGALLALAAELGRWAEAAAALERALTEVDSGDLALRLELAAELARIYDHELRDQERAISAYERLLAADPGNPETGRGAVLALARLYELARKWLELGWILRRQAEWADSVDDRAGLLARVAMLTENELGDKAGAISAWQEVLGEDSEHAEALGALERLYEEAHRWQELTDVLRRRVDLAGDPLEKRAHLTRISTLFERQIGSVHDAVAARLEVLDYLPDDESTLIELARLYRTEERFADLLEILERRLAMASAGPGRTELLFELAELLHQRLARDSDALRRYAQVIESDPSHYRAIAAVEQMLESEELLPRAAEVLEPLYAESGDHDKLAALLIRLTDRTDDVRTRIANLRRVAEIRELRLGDPDGALPALRQAVVLAVGEPELPELLKELERLAAGLQREGDLIDIYREIVPDVFDGELQRRLLLDIADLSRGVRNDVDLAREHYQKVLDINADDERALAALENIYRLQDDWGKLHDILIRNAELAGDNLDRRARALDEAASLCAHKLGRAEDAIAAWEQVLELTPDNRNAAESLEKIYESTERWHDLTELIERRLGFAFTLDEAVKLRLRLAQIYEQKLGDAEAAVENYSAVLGGAPNHTLATAALERYLDDPGSRSAAAEILQPIYVSRQDWPKLVRIFEIRLEAADDPAERQQLSRYIARLFEDQLEDLEGAFRWYGRVFREVPGDEQIRAQLVRLAGVLDSWSSLANVYQEFLDDESGDTPQVRDVALAVAAIYDRRIGSVDRAHAAYRRVLTAQPDDRETFRRMEELLARAERWRELVDAYEDAVQSTTDDAWRMEMYARMARTLESRLEDPDRAIDCYRAIADLDSGAQTQAGLRALDDLDRLYQEQGRWFDLADLLRNRIDSLPEGEPARERYRMRLAELLEKRLDDTEAAIDQYEILLAGSERAGALRELERLVVNPAHRERIARMLEPIYRNNDEWKKLVVILDAQLEFVAEPEQRVAMLREIARIHETRGGVPRMALEALAKAWREDVADQQSYDELLGLAAKLGEWNKLIQTFEGGIKDVYDTELQVKVLSRIAEINEANRDDPDAAIETWRRVLQIKDDDQDALTALDTLLDGTNRDNELVKVIERRGELAEDPAIRKVLLQRAAGLYEESLADKPAAIGAYKRVLEVDETDADALDALERLYRSQQEYRELAAVLARKIELAETVQTRRPLQFALASVYETHLTDPYEAIGQMNAVLGETPDDREALAALDGLYQREAMWPDLLRVLDLRADVEHEVPTQAELRYRSAQLVEKEMMEPEEAIQRYAGVLAIAPQHNATRRALDALTKHEDTIDSASEVLERQYRAETNHDALAELYERRLARQGADQALRQQQYSTLADIHETMRGDDDAAFAVWARALVEAPDDEGVQGQLERLAGSRGTWEELAALYEKRLADMVDPDLEHHYATRLGSIYEEALGDLDRAADKYRRALTTSSNEEPALVALSRIYERSQRWAELADILSRRAEAALDEDQQAEYLFRLGDVREVQLGELSDAMAAYSEVLDRDPHHVAARGALERMLAHEGQRGAIVAILEPLYETEGDVGRLADLLVTKLTITHDALERAHIYARVTELAETRLADPTRALDAAGGWLEEDPQSEEALSELERLADAVGRWGEVAARLSGIIQSSESRDQRLPLMDKLGVIQLERLRDLQSAEATFKAVLAIEPESIPSLERLETIYREREDVESLCGVLWRRGELAFDASVKRDCFAQVARLREQARDDDRAIDAWRHVIDLEEGDREAHRQLAAILDRHQKWQELIDLLHVSVRFAEAGEEVQVKTRIASLYTDRLGDLERAAEAWQGVLDSDPTSRSALEALETVQRRRKDWLAVQEALARQLDLATEPHERINLLLRLAEVAETERESPDEAIGYLQAILDIDNGHAPTYDALERLLRKGERWHELVDLFERAAEVHGTRGDSQREIDTLARAADVWEGPLENPDAAGEILEKILRRDPRYVPALTRLAKLYESQGDWEKCGEVLEKALALGPTGPAAAELHFRMGEVAREKSGDIDSALASFQRALGYDPAHAGAASSIETIARERDDWATVADMLSRRLGSTTDDARRLEQTLELAQLYGDKLGRPQEVVPLLELAARAAPTDARIIGPLADAYFAAGRHAEAAPMYETLADDAKKGRRMKDVAKYRQRAGGLFEAQGDIDRALAAYEDAFRIDPTNVTTMAGLGRIYMDRSDWEKARRVYRSMVLQNIDPEVGITKAIVYYNLGLIHLHLDEAKQAKGMFQRGLELEPDNAAIKQALAEL